MKSQSYKRPLTGLILTICIALQLNSQELRLGVAVPVVNRKKFSTDVELQSQFISHGNSNKTKNMATLSMEYDISRNFEIGGSYRLIVNNNSKKNRESDGLFQNEKSRTTLDFTYKTNRIDKRRVKNKVRYQISDMKNGEIEKSYLRNKLLVDYKLSKNLMPYYGFELIYRLEKQKLKSFRIYMGNRLEIFNRELNSFFIIENEMKKEPVNLNYILGFKVAL